MNPWPVFSLNEMIERSWVRLGRGKVISKRDIAAKPGPYPIYSSAKDGDGKFGEYGEYLFDEELITWSVDGGGRLFHRFKHRFSVTNVGGFLRILEPSILSYRFLWYALTLEHSRVGFDWVKKAHPSTIRREYKNIPVPALSEQTRIVAILDEAFEGITRATVNAERNLANARELASLAFRSQISRVDHSWVASTLGDQFTLQRGVDITKSEQRNGRVPVVSSGGIKSFHDTAIASAPGVVLGRKGSIGTVYFVEEDFWPHDTTLWVKDFKGNHPKFVFYVLKSLDLKTLDSGAANPALNRNNVHPIPVRWPPIEEQKRIVSVVDGIADCALQVDDLCKQKVRSCAELRLAILHKAFSGQLTGTRAKAA